MYLPAYVYEYTVLGQTFRAFVPGSTDSSGSAPAVSDVVGFEHKTGLSFSLTDVLDKFRNLTTPAPGSTSQAEEFLTYVVRKGGPFAILQLLKFPFTVFRMVNPTVRLAVLVLGAGRLLWNKFGKPATENKQSFDDWQKQVEREREDVRRRQLRRGGGSDWFDDFSTTERERREMRREREEEGRREEEKRRGEREEERREEVKKEQNFQWQWGGGQQESGQQQQQQQQQQGRGQRQRQGQGQQQRQQNNKSGGFTFDFDVNDPHAVLKLSPSASKADISKAFRREMLLWHPDHQRDKSEREQRLASERTKLITRAFQELKTTRR